MTYTPFYIVFTLIAFVGILELSSINRTYKNVSFFSIIVILSAFATMRSVGVGSDDTAYIDIFSRIPSPFECQDIFCGYNYAELNVEYGFFSLLSLFSIFGKSHFLLFGGVALPAIYLKLKSIKFYTPFFAGSVLIYFSHFFLAMELNAIRVGLASGVIFYAIKCFSEKKYLQFWFLYIIAIFVHVSSVLMMIPIVLLLFSPTRIHLLLISIAVILITAIIDKSKLLDIFVFVDFLSAKINLYQNAEQFNYSIPLYDPVNLKNIFISALCLMSFEGLRKKYKYFEITSIFFISASILRILLGDFAILAGRSYAAIAMFDCIIVPMLAVYFVGRLWGFILVLIYAFLLLSLNIFVNDGWGGGVAYLYDYF